MTISVDEVLSREKFKLFTMNLTAEELDQISLCRRGILGCSGLGAIFGVFGGKIALGPTPASILLKSIVMRASVVTGAIVGAGVSVQQSYNYLKSKPTNLAKELLNFSQLKKTIYKSTGSDTNDKELEDLMNEIYNKRTKKLPTSPK